MGMTTRAALLTGVAIGAVAAVVLGKDRINGIRAKAMDVWDGPQVQGTLRKADRFVADKAPTLHGVGEAVVDAASGKAAASDSSSANPPASSSSAPMPGATS